MPRLHRQYISEILSLGTTYKDIARELGVTPRRVKAWDMTKKPLGSFYEPIRNIARRTTYRYLRQSGMPAEKASGFRRLTTPKVIAETDWINMIIDTLYKDWNLSYRAYIANPKEWIAAHPNRKIPTEISRDDVKRRIEKGIKNGKSKEEIENY